VYYIQVNTAIQQQLWSNFFSFLEYLIEQKGVTYLLLDEIQNVPQWGGIVRAINDKFINVQLILCGSTTGLAQYARFINYFQSHIINREPNVTGRCVAIEMNTLSYPEFRDFLFGKTYVIGKELGGCFLIQFSLVYLFRRLL
jgi:hypothetical protein